MGGGVSSGNAIAGTDRAYGYDTSIQHYTGKDGIKRGCYEDEVISLTIMAVATEVRVMDSGRLSVSTADITVLDSCLWLCLHELYGNDLWQLITLQVNRRPEVGCSGQ